jgi:hypothetical protein
VLNRPEKRDKELRAQAKHFIEQEEHELALTLAAQEERRQHQLAAEMRRLKEEEIAAKKAAEEAANGGKKAKKGKGAKKGKQDKKGKGKKGKGEDPDLLRAALEEKEIATLLQAQVIVALPSSFSCAYCSDQFLLPPTIALLGFRYTTD